jgi:hypothetical protein
MLPEKYLQTTKNKLPLRPATNLLLWLLWYNHKKNPVTPAPPHTNNQHADMADANHGMFHLVEVIQNPDPKYER